MLQKVEMHKEKVSRREIGVFTAVKQVPRSHKVLPLTPSSTATRPRPPYSRQPINYQQLDGVGHGMKVSLSLSLYLDHSVCTVFSMLTGNVCYMLTGSVGGYSEPHKQAACTKTALLCTYSILNLQNCSAKCWGHQRCTCLLQFLRCSVN